MKSPIDIIRGQIVDYDPRRQELTIKAHFDDWYTLAKRGYKNCNIQLIDSRPLSDKQRRTCYKLIREISNHTGMGLDPTKEWMKLKFIAEDLDETADKIFSLSDAPMSLVCSFQRFLVDFIVDWDIPCSFPLLDFVDDVGSYVYACLVNKKCCVCGRPSDLHHVDRIGIRGSRKRIVHEGMEVLPLCREHHNEVHSIGQPAFNERYHLDGGVILDKSLCRIYKLKCNEDGPI